MKGNITRRRLLLGIAGFGAAALLPGGLAQATVQATGQAEIGEAINNSGRMRMLSQRMAKAYCQIGQGVLPDRSQKILVTSQQQFQAHLSELRNFAPSADIKESYVDLNTLWRRYQPLLSSNPNRDNARLIASLNEDVLHTAHLATTQLELLATGSTGRLINVAGRQRMLSQRLAKFYMLNRWGIQSPILEKESQLARREFSSALNALNRAPENDAAIKNELELARVQWLFFDEALKQQDSRDKNAMAHATNVATTSERLLEMMDRITGRYARIL